MTRSPICVSSRQKNIWMQHAMGAYLHVLPDVASRINDGPFTDDGGRFHMRFGMNAMSEWMLAFPDRSALESSRKPPADWRRESMSFPSAAEFRSYACGIRTARAFVFKRGNVLRVMKKGDFAFGGLVPIPRRPGSLRNHPQRVSPFTAEATSLRGQAHYCPSSCWSLWISLSLRSTVSSP